MWVSSWSTGTFGLDLSCPDGWHGFSESLSCYKWDHHDANDDDDNDNDDGGDDDDDDDDGGKCRFLDDYQQTWEAGQEHCRDWGAGWFSDINFYFWRKCESKSAKVLFWYSPFFWLSSLYFSVCTMYIHMISAFPWCCTFWMFANRKFMPVLVDVTRTFKF